MRSVLSADSLPMSKLVSNPIQSAPHFGSVHIIKGFKKEDINTQIDVVEAFQTYRKLQLVKPVYSWWPLVGTNPLPEGATADCCIEIKDGVQTTFNYLNCAAFIKQYANNQIALEKTLDDTVLDLVV